MTPEQIISQVPVLPCPHCGEPPRVSILGSCIEIWCCTGMSRQKTDYMCDMERKCARFNAATCMFSDELELKVLTAVAAEWNRRTPVTEETL